MKNTLNSNRTILLNFINKYNRPIHTKIILDNLKKQMNQATIYRNLNFLEENSYIEAFTFNCDKKGISKYYYKKSASHFHFLHCKECHDFKPIESCNFNKIEKLQKENSVKIESHVVYYIGFCSECLNRKNQ